MENRLPSIYTAACSLFITKGYVRTQMKDIAQEIKLSPGMLYVYFKGKQELLAFLLKCTIDPSFLHREFTLPIQATLFTRLDEEIMAVLEANLLQFRKALGQQGYTFEQMLSDAFDTVARYGTGCLLLEKNIHDLGRLGDAYQNYRHKFFSDLLDYIRYYCTTGQMRMVTHPELAVQQIIQTLAWWGMHVQNDAFERQQLSTDLAKEVCLDNLIHAYRITI